jgi:hypothetical protein
VVVAAGDLEPDGLAPTGTIEELPFEDRSVDVVISSSAPRACTSAASPGLSRAEYLTNPCDSRHIR